MNVRIGVALICFSVALLLVGSKGCDLPIGPSVEPIAGGGFRALVVYNSDTSRLAPAQRTALFSTAATAYLNDKCAKVDGRPEWHRWDDSFNDEDKAMMAAAWRKAYEQALKDSAGKLPWVYVTNGNRGISCELPATEDAWLALLKEYGGA